MTASPVAPVDAALAACRREIEQVRSETPLPGAPDLDRARAAILGRARGEPMVFVDTPGATEPADASGLTTARIRRLARRWRGNRSALRDRVLHDGYLYTSNPLDAFALVSGLRLTDLFDEPVIWMHRASRIHRLVRAGGKRRPRYTFSDGPRRGRAATLLFGDRVARMQSELEAPLHRDFRSLAEETGFDRAKVLHRTSDRLVAELRFGNRWVTALLASRGAELRIQCLDAEASLRSAITAWQRSDSSRRRAVGQLRQSVGRLTAERLPFDRPRHVTDHLKDGQLRPLWNWAYRTGLRTYSHEGETYYVYDGRGRPVPPEVCVEFILDAYERAGGSWYRARGDRPSRPPKRLDFDTIGIENRQGVIALLERAERLPDAFEVERFEGSARIPFAERSRFFGYLAANADRFRPGDIVAIRGRKSDGNVHQHAILVEGTDPLTGFPYALADQMEVPRRRTWENIMAEAPRRSLYYRVRLRAELLSKLDPETWTAEAPLAQDR